MFIHAVISHKKVKNVYGVRTIKEIDEVIESKFVPKLEEIAEEGFWYYLWNDDGTRKYGRSYSIKTNNKKDLKKVEKLLQEVADKVELL